MRGVSMLVAVLGLSAVWTSPAAAASTCYGIFPQPNWQHGFSEPPCPYSEATAVGGWAPGAFLRPADVAISPDGHMAIGDAAGAVHLVAGDRAPLRLHGDAWYGSGPVAFMPDGTLLAAEHGMIHRFKSDATALPDIVEGLTDSTGTKRAISDLAVGADGTIHGVANGLLLGWRSDGSLKSSVALPGSDALAVDGLGRLYVLRSNLERVDEIDPATGAAVRSFGPIAGNPVMRGLAIDAQQRVVVATTERFEFFAQTGEALGAVLRQGAHDYDDAGLAAAGDALWLASDRTASVRAWNLTGEPLPGIDGRRGTGLSAPKGAAATPDGRIYVSDSGGRRLVEFAADGTFTRTVRDWRSSDGSGPQPLAVALGPGEEIAVTLDDPVKGPRIERLSKAGDVLSGWEVRDARRLTGIAYGPGGLLYAREIDFGDAREHRVRVFHPDGAPARSFSVDGYRSSDMAGLAFDRDGNLYTPASRSIHKLTPAGELLATYPSRTFPRGLTVLESGHLMVAGEVIEARNANGSPLLDFSTYSSSVGRLGLPGAQTVTADAAGHLFVVDEGRNRVVRLTMRPDWFVVRQNIPPPQAPPPWLTPAPGTTWVGGTYARVAITCRAEWGACDGTLRLRGRAGRRLLGKSAFALAPGTTKRLRVRLRRPALVRVRRGGRLRARASASLRSGSPVSWKLTLRRR